MPTLLEVLIAAALIAVPTVAVGCSLLALGWRYSGLIDLAVFCISLVVVFAILQRQRLEH